MIIRQSEINLLPNNQNSVYPYKHISSSTLVHASCEHKYTSNKGEGSSPLGQRLLSGSLQTIHVVARKASNYIWHLYWYDIKNVFLQGNI